VLARRTRTSIESWDRGVAAAPKVADLMADVLGWDAAEKKREVDAYVGRVAAERKSQTEPDDDTAEAARLDTLDIAVPSQAGEPTQASPPSQRTKAAG
jgi:glycerol-3-phosphate dehydrogenase